MTEVTAPPNDVMDPPAATAVLLEMDFVQRPQVDVTSSCQPLEFFLPPLGLVGRLGRSLGGVCADERVVQSFASRPSSIVRVAVADGAFWQG